ncbi:DNA-3-methyladenine glycosylase [Sinorhizobium sp. BG8]|uniref:DNA-3-methyladenine glycosylase family protein n=1 Tax=Sinorhizobium sp. BG8 TaxID=2613773 RepID=UPI00193E66F1|nr:DNA-3-methyladenine glycosylase [Sinorhizobium sp. BG8]QRM56757.1 DNA-3-methyladenine glycosylase 2 family protein [Sinorhizobium sp. BG8]
MHMIRTKEDVAAGLVDLALLDRRLFSVIDKAGPVPLRRLDPGYRGIAGIIVSQMVSRASANAIWGRLEAAAVEITPHHVLNLSDADLRGAGLSRSKAETLRRVAEAIDGNALDLDAVCHMEAEAAIRLLTQIKGVGRWTAEVYLLFCAGHPDVFPAGDVALQNAVAHAFGLVVRPSAAELDQIAATWSPWRGVSARLFWAYYSRAMRSEAAPVMPE